MSIKDEKPVNGKKACEQLGCARRYMSALRRAMGIKSRYFFLSDVRKYMRDHPDFTSSQFYHRKECRCAACGEKQAARLAAVSNEAVGQGNVPLLATPSFSISEPLVVKKAAKPLKAAQHPVYSELGRKLKMLRGRLSAGAVAAKAGVSTESVRRIEHGDSVKVATLRQIATGMGVSRAQWLGLLIAWLKFEAGKDSDELRIDPSRPISRSYFRALRRAMGRPDDRVFDVVVIRRWLAQHPNFKESSIYARTNSCPRLMCSCGREVSVMRGGRTHAHNKPDGTECCGVRV